MPPNGLHPATCEAKKEAERKKAEAPGRGDVIRVGKEAQASD